MPKRKPRVGAGVRKAVALKYDPALPAPFLVAKGAGDAAERIVGLAREAGVPVVRDDDAAGFLFPFDIGDYVPETFWEALAAIYIAIREVEAG
ncbi:MAG: EscU/YscU/HrcU family type III secretion system export apparatus switch protein [Spirochaetes bacterium]|nr:EscU/YscU/HrcU family type III secretion system export apparatus switch protein [Spirochaetota bacterium]